MFSFETLKQAYESQKDILREPRDHDTEIEDYMKRPTPPKEDQHSRNGTSSQSEDCPAPLEFSPGSGREGAEIAHHHLKDHRMRHRQRCYLVASSISGCTHASCGLFNLRTCAFITRF